MTNSILAYLFGSSQAESELDAVREHIEEVLEAAEEQEPLKSKKTPLANALKALDVEAGDALEYGPEGFSLRYDDDDVYRDACAKLCEPEGMEKLADLGWVALRSGDRAMSNEPPEFRVRFVAITTTDSTDADKPSQTLATLIKAGREFVQQEPEQDKDNPVEHPDAPNKQHAGMGDAKDGKDPEGKPKGSGKSESHEYQPKTGERCTCKPGSERDNCGACEGTGMKIDFARIRSRKSTKDTAEPKDESTQLVDSLLDNVNEGGHKAGCTCGFCRNKGSFGKKKEKPEDSAKSDEPKDDEPKSDEPEEKKDSGGVEHTFDAQDEPPRYDDITEDLARKRGRPKQVKDAPVARKPKSSGAVTKAYKTPKK